MSESFPASPLSLNQCRHKRLAGCLLSTWSPCCACADRRAHTSSYNIYIDGAGYLPLGSRWSNYCDSCKAYWNAHHPTAAAAAGTHQTRRSTVTRSRRGVAARATGSNSSQLLAESDHPPPTPMDEPNTTRHTRTRRSSSVSRLRRSSELSDDDWRLHYHSASPSPGIAQLRARGEMYRRVLPADNDRFPSAAARAQIMGLASELERLQLQVWRNRRLEDQAASPRESADNGNETDNNSERPAPPRSLSDGRANATVGMGEDFFESWTEIDGENRRRERERSRLWSPRLDAFRLRSPSPPTSPLPQHHGDPSPGVADHLRQRHHRRRISTSEVVPTATTTPTVMPGPAPEGPRRLWRLNGIENLEAELASLSEPGNRRRSELSALSREIRDIYREAGVREAADLQSTSGMSGLPSTVRNTQPSPPEADSMQRERERESLRALWGDVDSEDYVSPVTALFQRSWQDHNRRQQELRQHQQMRHDTHTSNPNNTNSPDMNLPSPPQTFAEIRAAATGGENTSSPTMDMEQEVLNARRYMRARLSLVRQERAAAGRPEPVGLDNQKGRPPPLDSEDLKLDCECKVCFQQVADTVLLPCAHLVLCEWCADQIGAKKRSELQMGMIPTLATCPVCRSAVTDRVKVFRG